MRRLPWGLTGEKAICYKSLCKQVIRDCVFLSHHIVRKRCEIWLKVRPINSRHRHRIETMLGDRMGLGMDWIKVERVRRSIERGDYTHPAFLISSIETDFDRFGDKLLCDINEPAEQVRKAMRVSETLWRKCLQYPLADCLICR